MKKLNFLLASLALLLGFGFAHAEIVSPYSVNFDGTIQTTDHAFKVATGWDHIVESAYLGYSSMYVTYTQYPTRGVDGSGTLYIASQTLEDYGDDEWGTGYESQEVHDYLVTPAVSGNVSVKVKKYITGSYLQVYKCTKNANGTFTVGDTLDISDGTTTAKSYRPDDEDNFVTVNLGNFSEPTYLAIRGNYIYLDDFSAASADIERVRSLKINNVDAIHPSADVNAEGKFPITVGLNMTNNGDYDLNPGDADFKVAIYDRDSKDTIGVVPLTRAIPAGTDGRDTVTVYADYASHRTRSAYKIHEYVSGSDYAYQVWITPVPYVPVLSFKNSDGSDVDTTAVQNFGLISKATSRKYVISNTGAAPLNVTSITVPEGFAVDKSAVTVQPHDADTLTVTALVDNLGEHSGKLVITADGLDPYSVNLKATALDTTKYFISFDEGYTIPSGTMREGTNWSVVSWNVDGNLNVLENSRVDEETKFITPLLKVRDGEVMTFEAGKRNYNSFINTYYSTDRVHWVHLDSIGSSEMSSVNVGTSWSEKYALTTYTISGIPAGNYYIAFGSGYAHLDNIYGFERVPVAHDLMISSQDIPVEGTVNDELQASASISNIGNKEAAGSYTATFHFGDQTVTGDPVELQSGVEKNFTFALTPHAAGTFPAYIDFVFNDGTRIATDTANVVVAPEIASAEVQVGTKASSSANVPLALNYCNSMSETVYDADLLGNLANGSKITSITYRGYKNSADQTTNVSIWIQNTTDAPAESASDFTPTSRDEMTLVYSGPYTFKQGGTASNSVPLLSVNLSEPFTYTGGNLRVVVESRADEYKMAYFDATDADRHSYYKRVDNPTNYENTTSYTDAVAPVVYFGIEKEPAAVNGTVKNNAGAPISGASIKFTSGSVEYSGTTDAEGKYNVQILKDDRTYTQRVDAAGYAPSITSGLHVDSTVTRDIVLEPATGLFIEKYSIPTTGAVNSSAQAAVTLSNDIAGTIAADAYDAKLYVGDDEVATATGKTDIAQGGSVDLAFAFTPHKAGKFPAYIKATYGENEYTSAIDSIDIAEEDFGGEYTAGDSTMLYTATGVHTPWDNYYKKAQSVIVYTPDIVNLPAGSVIKRIRFRGRQQSSSEGQEAVSMYIANSDVDPKDEAVSGIASEIAGPLIADTASMTRILNLDDDSLSYGGDDYNVVRDIIDAEIPGDGLVYNGGSLVIVFNGNHIGGSDNRLETVVDGTKSGYAFGRHTDNGDINTQSWGSQSSLPVLYMTVVNRKSVHGTVINKKTNEPVANASVLLSSNGVEYRDTTDAEGKYSVDVAKTSLTYDVIFSAEGFTPDTVKNFTLAEGNETELNDTIAPVPVITNVSGTVRYIQLHAGQPADKASAQPLAGASVTVMDDSFNIVNSVVTGEDGAYTIGNITEGKAYTLMFTADNYAGNTVSFTATDQDTIINDTLTSASVKIDVTGTVKGVAVVNGAVAEAEPLAGATVTVANANGATVATATTAADGTYTIADLDEDSVYTFTFAADGYVSQDTTFTAGDENLTVDKTLWTEAALGIDGITVDGNNADSSIFRGNVYTIGGQLIGRDVEKASLRSGVYIINGKKVTVK